MILVEASQYKKAIKDGKLDQDAANHSALAPWFNEAAALTNSQREKIESPFKYKQLIEAINKQLGNNNIPNILTKIIPNYAELSGFVHGGPSAWLILDSIPQEQIQANLLRDAKMVVGMTASARKWLLTIAEEANPDLLLRLHWFSKVLEEE